MRQSRSGRSPQSQQMIPNASVQPPSARPGGERERPAPHLSRRPRSRPRDCRTSALDRMCGSLCGAILGGQRSGCVLERRARPAGGHDNLQQRPGSEPSRDWPAGYGPNSPRSRQAPSGVVAYGGSSCGSRRSCARISCPGRSESGGCRFGPGRDTERTPGAGSLGSRQAAGSRQQASAWSGRPGGTCSGIARI